MDLHHRASMAAPCLRFFSPVRPPTTLPYIVIQLLLTESRQALSANLQALSGVALSRCGAGLGDRGGGRAARACGRPPDRAWGAGASGAHQSLTQTISQPGSRPADTSIDRQHTAARAGSARQPHTPNYQQPTPSPPTRNPANRQPANPSNPKGSPSRGASWPPSWRTRRGGPRAWTRSPPAGRRGPTPTPPPAPSPRAAPRRRRRSGGGRRQAGGWRARCGRCRRSYAAACAAAAAAAAAAGGARTRS